VTELQALAVIANEFSAVMCITINLISRGGLSPQIFGCALSIHNATKTKNTGNLANFAHICRTSKKKSFQLQWASPHDKGLRLWTPLEASLSDFRYTLALHALAM